MASFSNPLQAPSDLPATDVYGGVTVQNSFYDYLANELISQNAGRTAVHAYDPFDDLADEIDGAYSGLTSFLNGQIVQGAATLCASYPNICSNPYYTAAIAGIALACDIDGTLIHLDVVEDSERAHFTVDQIAYSPDFGKHVFDVSLSDIGILLQSNVQLEIGSCLDLIDEILKTQIGFTDLTYRVEVDLTTLTPTVTTTLLTPTATSDLFFNIEGLSIAFGLTSIGSDGFAQDVYDLLLGFVDPLSILDEYATEEVPTQLTTMFENFWVPYVPGNGSRIDVSATQQNASYAQNRVFGTIDPPAFTSRTTTVGGTRVQTSFIQGHSPVTADPQAVGAGGVFNPSSASVDFANETIGVDGNFYISEAALRHSAVGALRAGVGLRDNAKDLGRNDLRIDYGFDRLTPEHGGKTLTTLLTDPMDGILPVPMTADQIDDLLVLNSSLGQQPMDGLTLEIEVRENNRIVALPFVDGVSSDFGAVRHFVTLEAAITSVNGRVVWASETFDCQFITRLYLQHDRRRNQNVFNGTRTLLVSMVNENGIAADDIDGNTAVADAPVMFFLRSLISTRSANPGVSSDLPQYLVDGLASPLVGRSVQNVFRFPGMDIAAFDGLFLGNQSLYDGCFDVGLVYDVPAQCAEIERWGVRDGIPFTGNNDRMVVVNVNWSPQDRYTHVDMNTTVSTSAVGINTTTLFPSLADTGYVQMRYAPGQPGDESRVTHGTGFKTTPFLPNGGVHYVTATAAGFRNLAQNTGILSDPTATLELIPYTGFSSASTRDCSQIQSDNPAMLGIHTDDTDYQAFTFQSRQSCVGLGTCDGERVVFFWNAPLDPLCGNSRDSSQFSTFIPSARLGPDRYVINPQNCTTDGGGNSGGAGPLDGPIN